MLSEGRAQDARDDKTHIDTRTDPENQVGHGGTWGAMGAMRLLGHDEAVNPW